MQKSRPYYLRTVLLLLGSSLLLVSIVASCRKDSSTAADPVLQVELAGFPSSFNFNCVDSPVYEDSILCAKYRGPDRDYFARPLNRLPNGKYYSWPSGLVMDANTGVINVTQSEGGVRYVVGFVKEGTTDTCHTKVIIAGIHYKDNVYILAKNDTLAIPYFDANPLSVSPCDPSDDTDYPGSSNVGGNARCEYDDDEDDDNGNGPADEPPTGQQANEQNVRVRTKTGIINLKKTLEDGAFGLFPENGTTKDVRIYYRLADCSLSALRSIKVRLIYYEKKSDIPPSLLAEILQKKYSFESSELVVSSIIDSPRPPLIIVTSFE
jgi:hypothetical protein